MAPMYPKLPGQDPRQAVAPLQINQCLAQSRPDPASHEETENPGLPFSLISHERPFLICFQVRPWRRRCPSGKLLRDWIITSSLLIVIVAESARKIAVTSKNQLVVPDPTSPEMDFFVTTKDQFREWKKTTTPLHCSLGLFNRKSIREGCNNRWDKFSFRDKLTLLALLLIVAVHECPDRTRAH